MTRAARYTLYGQLLFLGGLTVCAILMPQFLFSADQGGMSNYGTYAKTVIPFSVAFLGLAAGAIAAARTLPEKTTARKTLYLILMSIGLLMILATVTTYPYRLNNTLRIVHIVASQALFFAEIPAALWFWLGPARGKTNHVLFGIYLVGLVLAGLTTFGSLHVLFVAESLAGIGLGFLMVHSTHKLTRREAQS